MNINNIREKITAGAEDGSFRDAELLALGMVYLGDSIRETMSDIGPALEKGLEQLAINVADIGPAVGDLGREIASAGSEIANA